MHPSNSIKTCKTLFTVLCVLAMLLQPCVAVAEGFVSGFGQPPAHNARDSSMGGQVTGWGKHLNKDGDIPTGKFKAFYFDRTNKQTPPVQEIVDNVSVQGGFYTKGIKSGNFAAYWVGRFEFDETTTKTFYFNISWSSARLIIDGKFVRKRSEGTVYTFKPGAHVIEVEYINNWHTVGFGMRMKDAEPDGPHRFATEDEVVELFREMNDHKYELHVAAVYESANGDASLDVNIAAQETPVVLWLNSYEGVGWRIQNPHDTPLLAVVYASYSKASDLEGVSEYVPVLAFNKWTSMHNVKFRSCSCSGGHFHCEVKKDLLQINAEFEGLYGKSIDAYAGGYKAAELTPAENRLDDDAFKQEILDARDAMRKSRESCRSHAYPDFDNMFDNDALE